MRTSMKTVLFVVCLIAICVMGAVDYSTHPASTVQEHVDTLTHLAMSQSLQQEWEQKCADLEEQLEAARQPAGPTLVETVPTPPTEPALREKGENGVPVKYAEFHQQTLDAFSHSFEQAAGRRVADVFKQKASEAIVKFIDRHSDAEMDAMISLPMPGQGTDEQTEEFFRVTAGLSADIVKACRPYITTAQLSL